MPLHHFQNFRRGGWWKLLPGIQEMSYFAENPGVSLRSPPNHQAVGSGIFQHLSGVLHGHDIAVGKDRDIHCLANSADRLVFGLTFETVRTRSAMHGESSNTCLFRHLCDLDAVSCPWIGPGSDFEGYRYFHRPDHRIQNQANPVRLRQQSRTSQFVADFLGRAAHVDIDDLGATRNVVKRCIGHPGGVTAGDLNHDRAGFALEITTHARCKAVPQ